MFELAEKKEIGQHLRALIGESVQNQRFKNQRQFCKEYLTIKGEPTDEEQLRRMSNRLSQILNGKKEIQLYDLPLFCRLLEVSCEEILSAGKYHAPAPTRLTNYIVAFSQDKSEWKQYVAREDSPILNADEYGKIVIDYALEAGNYPFLKYLMEQKLIWFVGTEEKDFYVGFGAGTSIEKAVLPYPKNWHVLDAQLCMRDELRTNMIALAIHHKDMAMLEQLHAREIPTLYQMTFYSPPPNDCKQYYNTKLMDALIHADTEVLDYFSQEFTLTDRLGYTDRFLFPFLGELIEQLLQKKHDFVEHILKNAIQHSQYVYDQLTLLLDETVRFYKNLDYDTENAAIRNELTARILRDLRFYGDGDLIGYFALPPGTQKSLKSNIIRVNWNGAGTPYVKELNDLYDAIHNMTPNFEEHAISHR